MNSRLRLLTVCNFFDSHRGGLDIVAGTLAREIAARDVEVTWLATRETDAPPAQPGLFLGTRSVAAWNLSERMLGIPFPVPSPSAFAQLAEAVKDTDALLVHDTLYPLSIAAILMARRQRKPVVVLQHIGAVPYRNLVLKLLMAAANRCLAKPMLAAADQVVFISEGVRDFFKTVRFRSDPALIFNGVDTAVFRPAGPGEKRRARADFGLAPDATVALFAGRFVEKKGLHHLRAMAAANPDITWALAGWGVIDPAGWGLSNVRVFSDLAGFSLAELYRASDVFVLPSCGEGFPLVIQEALACGLPVVCGMDSVAADRVAAPFLAGVAMDQDDQTTVADACVRRVREILAAPSQAEAARRRVALARERYAWSAAADRYLAIIRGLVDGPACSTWMPLDERAA